MAVVVRAKIQTVEEAYGLMRHAVTGRQPISAVYDGLPRLLCPHRLGHTSAGQPRVLCYQYGGESSTKLEPSGSPANWRCLKLDKFSRVELREDVWHTAPNHSRPQTCITHVDVDAEHYPERNPQSGQQGREADS
jgi:hypothetical protein